MVPGRRRTRPPPYITKRPQPVDEEPNSITITKTENVVTTPTTTTTIIPSTSPLDPNLLKAFQFCALSSFIGAWGGVAAKYNLQYAQFGDVLQSQCHVLFSISSDLDPKLSPLSPFQSIGLQLPFLLPLCTTLIGVIVKIVQLGMTLGLNTWGLSYALRASHLAPTSVTNTICSGFSFLMNAGLGMLLFKEQLSQRFFLGLLLILLGLFLICHDQIKQSQSHLTQQRQGQGQEQKDQEKVELQQQEQLEKPSEVKKKSRNNEKMTVTTSNTSIGSNNNESMTNDVEILSPQSNACSSFFYKIHVFFEPLEEKPFETFIFGLLVGLVAVLILGFIMLRI